MDRAVGEGSEAVVGRGVVGARRTEDDARGDNTDAGASNSGVDPMPGGAAAAVGESAADQGLCTCMC